MSTEAPVEAPVINPETTDSTPAPAHVSIDDAISKALDEADTSAPVEEAEEQPAPKAKEQPKEEAKQAADEDAESDDDSDDDDAAKAEKEADADSDDEEESQPKPKVKDRKPRPTIAPPEKFVEEARTHWASVPHVVRAEVDRVTKEYEGALQYYRPLVERYERLREFDEAAHRNGIDLRQSIERFGHLENLVKANPLAGINQILLQAGPRKPDGHPVSLYELATHIVQMGPDGYNKAVTQMPQQPQQQGPDPQIAALQQRIAQMEQEQTRNAVLGPFAEQNPRFKEPAVQEAIAQILKSGMVPTSLPASERLAKAYDMAVRLVQPNDEYDGAVEEEEQQPRRRVDGSGATPKQIRGGTPGNGASKSGPKRPLTRDEAIKQAMAALR